MPLSDHDQRVLAALDVQVATNRGTRTAARLRARWTARQLNLATVALAGTDFGLLTVGVHADSRVLVTAVVLLLAVAPTPTTIALRYSSQP